MLLRKVLPVLGLVALASTACATLAVAAATVNGEKITEAGVEAEFDTIEADPAFGSLLQQEGDTVRGRERRALLSRLIIHTLVRQQANERGVDVTNEEADEILERESRNAGAPSVDVFLEQQQLTREQGRRLAERLLYAQELQDDVTADLEVPEEDIRGFYEQNRTQFEEVHLLGVTVATEEEARAMIAQVEGGTLFSRVAEERSQDERAGQGGDLGFVPLSALPGTAQDQLRALPEEGITEPIQTTQGWEVYQLLGRRTTPIEDVRDRIADSLLGEERQVRFRDWLVRELRAADVVVNPKYGRFDPDQLGVVPGPEELPE